MKRMPNEERRSRDLRTEVDSLRAEFDNFRAEFNTFKADAETLKKLLRKALLSSQKGVNDAEELLEALHPQDDPASHQELRELSCRTPTESKVPERPGGNYRADEPHDEHDLSDEQREIVRSYKLGLDMTLFGNEPEPFGAVNTNELQRSANASPTFGRTDRGAYLLIKTRIGEAYVVPKPGLVYQEAYHKGEAMGRVFECEGYQPGSRYRYVELVRPALFSRRSGKWELCSPGKIRVS
jgi:hypothetical protein